MRILVVEDDKKILELLRLRLKSEGFSVDIESDGNKGSYLARTNNYDLIILDFILPYKSGLKICLEIRERNQSTPIIIMSIKNETPAKVELFNMGADDFIVKPFPFDELLARIRALLRRQLNIQNEIISIANLNINTTKYKAVRAGKEVILTKKEFGLLEYLMRNKGAVMSRGSIMEHVWDIHADLFSNTIETHILNLRKKIDKPYATKLIHTVSGRGYKIDTIK